LQLRQQLQTPVATDSITSCADYLTLTVVCGWLSSKLRVCSPWCQANWNEPDGKDSETWYIIYHTIGSILFQPDDIFHSSDHQSLSIRCRCRRYHTHSIVLITSTDSETDRKMMFRKSTTQHKTLQFCDKSQSDAQCIAKLTVARSCSICSFAKFCQIATTDKSVRRCNIVLKKLHFVHYVLFTPTHALSHTTMY
jgi:hypothetical protein